MTTATVSTVHDLEAVQLNDMARTMVEQGRDDEAVLCLFRALTLAPDFAMARLHLGEILLRRGEYLPGWIEFEWGSRLGIAGDVQIHAPQWNGMRLPASTLILLASQGFGDVIQFARYIPPAAARCQRLAIGCSPEMQSLLGAIEGVDATFVNWQDAPPFATYAPLTSLGHVFGTTLDTIPSPGGYLAADPARTAAWARRLTRDHGCPAGARKIGIVWAGRPTHSNDGRRSMKLPQWAPILANRDARFFALQKVMSDEDQVFARTHGVTLLGDRLDDFADTAGLIAALDLVITVDTSVAHLAGALGRPVWILLPRLPDWRWLDDRTDSPWYASATLFRQARMDDWTGPVAAVDAALRRPQAGSLGG